MFCTKCGQEIPAMANFCPNCGKEAVQQKNDTKYFNKNDNTMSLVEFRRNAPFMTGHREKLLAYRKGLPNNWDYNAYMGILLGVGGSKHGDAACKNFAIGQGDNGNNTRKTLESRGLMPLFEKYKGKKIDTSAVISDVEDEIISIVPEYIQIRNMLATILQMENDNFSTSADVTEPKKIEELPIERNMLEKYDKLSCHKVAYSFIPKRFCGVEEYRSKDSFSSSGLVVEHEQYLYYVKNQRETIEFRKISLRGDKPATIIAQFDRTVQAWGDPYDEIYGYNDTFWLGKRPVFSIQNEKIYYSLAQIVGANRNKKHEIENNEVWSMDIFNPMNKKKEFKLASGKDKMIYSPYVIGNKLLVSAFSGRSYVWEYLLDKSGVETVIHKSDDFADDYLAINEDSVIVDRYTETSVRHFQSGEKTSIKKEYKNSKTDTFFFIDGERDVFYYLENKENIFGEILGISKSGDVVDRWKSVTDMELLKLAKSGECYFSCDGNLRIYIIKVNLYEKELRGDYIFAVDREGKCDKRFEHKHNGEGHDEMLYPTSFFIQTPNAVIVECIDHNERQMKEYLITLTGEKNIKPLF